MNKHNYSVYTQVPSSRVQKEPIPAIYFLDDNGNPLYDEVTVQGRLTEKPLTASTRFYTSLTNTVVRQSVRHGIPVTSMLYKDVSLPVVTFMPFWSSSIPLMAR